MKYLTLFVIYLVLSSSMSTLLDRRSRTKRSSKRSTTKQAKNKWVRLLFGAVVGISNTSPTKINDCVPDALKGADEKAVIEKPDEKKSMLTKALDIISQVLNFICNFKDKIKEFFKRRLKRLNKKVFLQRYRAMGLFDDIMDGIKSVGEYVKKKWEDIKDWGKKLADNIVGLWTQVKDIVSKIVNSEFVQTIKKIYDCFETAKKTGEEIVKVIKGIYDKVQTVIAGGWVGVAKVFIDLICAFDTFRESVNFLIQALGTASIPDRWELYGKFAGRLLRALGSKKVFYVKKN